MKNKLKNIVLIGSGNVAGFFGNLLQHNGFKIQKIISRNPVTGKTLAETLETELSIEYTIPGDCDLLIMAVKDDVIPSIASQITEGDFMICHTAGAVSLDALKRFKNRGVLYPLQSMRGHIRTDDVPMMIEGNSEENFDQLKEAMQSCNLHCYKVSSEQRLYYHLAAVFANNFSIAMLAASEKIALLNHLDPELLKPLVRHTFENALLQSATESQTGPAMRGDQVSMKKHIDLLSDYPDLQDLYRKVSAYISAQRKP